MLNRQDGESAELTIEGDGNLVVSGGNSSVASATSGAGIGGNGFRNTFTTDNADCFGSITINSGNVTATGGTYPGVNYGAGAGIGSGGAGSGLVS